MSNLRYLLHFVLCWTLIHTQVVFTVAWAADPAGTTTTSGAIDGAAATKMAGDATAKGEAAIAETEAEIKAAEAEHRKKLNDAITAFTELEEQEDFKNFGSMFDIQSQEGQNAKEDAQMKGIADAGTHLICSPIGEVASDAYTLFVSASSAYIADVVRDADDFKQIFLDITENNPLDAPDAANKDRQYIDVRKSCQLAEAREEAVNKRIKTKERACDLYSGAYAAAERELGDKIARVTEWKAKVKAAKAEVKSAMMALAMDLAGFLLKEQLHEIAMSLREAACAAFFSGTCPAALSEENIKLAMKIAGFIKVTMDIMKLMKAMQKLKKAKRELKRAMIHSHLKCSNSMIAGVEDEWVPLEEENSSTDLGLRATGLKAARGVNAYHYFVTQRSTEAKEQVAMFPVPISRRDYTKRVYEFCFSSLEGTMDALLQVSEDKMIACKVADQMNVQLGQNKWDVANGANLKSAFRGRPGRDANVEGESSVCIGNDGELDKDCKCKGANYCRHMDLKYSSSLGVGNNKLDSALGTLLNGANQSTNGSTPSLSESKQKTTALTIRKQIKKEQQRVNDLLIAAGRPPLSIKSSQKQAVIAKFKKGKKTRSAGRAGGAKMVTVTATAAKKVKGLPDDELNFDDLKMEMDDPKESSTLNLNVAAKDEEEDSDQEASFKQIRHSSNDGPLGSTEGEQIHENGDSEIFKLITKRYIRSAFPVLLKRADEY
ncbi:MAG: hypothetical protein HN353_07330 [Bdellovibrionales bacterium]|nr:hypothetical protein [Bdellovibrionales bacterium]MBT3526622.1 hypothetical protein [Bdellovibrionales bacterium]